MNHLLIYKTYPDLASAEEIANLLIANGITVEVIEEPRILDSNYMGQQFSNAYLLYMPGADFEQANTILEQETVVNPDDVDPGYMLLGFSEDELIEVMEKKDDWGVYNYKLAEALLKKKNAQIPEVKIALEQAAYLKEKEKPVASEIMFLLLGYASVLSGIVALFQPVDSIVIFLFQGLPGIFIGGLLSRFKRILSNGQLTFYFTRVTRIHGNLMFWTGLAITALKVILILLNL